MKTRFLHTWDKLTSSYWFVPAVMTSAATLLAILLLYLDYQVIDMPEGLRLLYAGDADGARDLLGTVASSVITVAGVVFSITISAMTLASQQFGPRLLRNFMRDTGNQIVLGTFVATFIYCLLVLRTIRGEEAYPGEGDFVPHLAVTVAVLFAIASIIVLIYFIHHISQSLQAPYVIATAGRDLEQAIERMFPSQLGRQAETAAIRPPPMGDEPGQDAAPVKALRQGYVQAINTEQLMDLAVRHSLFLRLTHRPGHWVMRGAPLAHVQPASRVDEAIAGKINDAFILGRQRTAEQDIEHAISQMVEIACRAMSPSINDPYTAITCIDWLGNSLACLACHDLPTRFRYDDRDTLRIIAQVSTFPGLVDASFNQIRQFAVSSRMVAVIIRLLEVIKTIGSEMQTLEQRQALLRHAMMVHADSLNAVANEQDRADILSRYEAAVKALGPETMPPPL